MENWRGLFRERFVIEENTEEKYLRKYDHRTIVEELEHFIEQELDRAREEGIREGLEDILSEVENWKTHYLDTTKSEPSKTMQIGLVNVIRKMLSKLTTK